MQPACCARTEPRSPSSATRFLNSAASSAEPFSAHEPFGFPAGRRFVHVKRCSLYGGGMAFSSLVTLLTETPRRGRFLGAASRKGRPLQNDGTHFQQTTVSGRTRAGSRL